MSYTFTRTAVRYSTDSEVNTIRFLLNRVGTIELADNALLFSEIAGIARFELDEKRNQGEHSYLIDAHYQDANNLIEDNLQVRSEGRRIAGYLADLMERISTDTEQVPPQQWLSEVYLYLVEEKGLTLTQEQCFGLGLSTFFLAGPPDYRRSWKQREGGVPPVKLMTDRKLTKEVLRSIKRAWDEISPPLTPEGQMPPQAIK